MQFPKLLQKNTAALSTGKDPFGSSSELSIHLLIQLLNKCIALLLCAGLHMWLRQKSPGSALCSRGTQGRELVGAHHYGTDRQTPRGWPHLLSLLLLVKCLFNSFTPGFVTTTPLKPFLPGPPMTSQLVKPNGYFSVHSVCLLGSWTCLQAPEHTHRFPGLLLP